MCQDFFLGGGHGFKDTKRRSFAFLLLFVFMFATDTSSQSQINPYPYISISHIPQIVTTTLAAHLPV